MDSDRAAGTGIARRALRAVLAGDIDQIETLYAPDVRLHNKARLSPGGLAGVRERALQLTAGLWDATICFDYCVESGDMVAVRWSARGRTTGWGIGAGAPGRDAYLRGVSILRVRSGQVAEDWTEYGALEFADQRQPAPADRDCLPVR